MVNGCAAGAPRVSSYQFPVGSSGERLAVDISTMSDVKDENGPSRVVYLVDDAVVTNPDPPAFATDQ